PGCCLADQIIGGLLPPFLDPCDKLRAQDIERDGLPLFNPLAPAPLDYPGSKTMPLMPRRSLGDQYAHPAEDCANPSGANAEVLRRLGNGDPVAERHGYQLTRLSV